MYHHNEQLIIISLKKSISLNRSHLQNDENAKKKAAKKAEKAAKKAAHKAAQAAGGGSDGGVAKKAAVSTKAATTTKSSPFISASSKKSSVSKLLNNQLSFNPNVPLTERPVVALAIACLTNSQSTYSIISDHSRTSGPALGLPSGGEVVGDAAIARYVARSADSNHALLGGSEYEQVAIVDSWMDYAQTLSKFQLIRRVKAVAATLSHTLAEKTYVVGHSLTIADIALFAAIGFPTEAVDAAHVESILLNKPCALTRWMKMMRSHPAIREATQLAKGISTDNETVFDQTAELEPLVEGMNPLEGATLGNVCTRFPPEPSGYLHIGHAKVGHFTKYLCGRKLLQFTNFSPPCSSS